MESRQKQIRDLADYHRNLYNKALCAGRAARTKPALDTAQGWMDHHGALVLRFEAAL